MDNLYALKELAANLTVLYVEDNEKEAEQVSIFLNKFFKKTVVAKDGYSGFNAYQNYKPDIVITDISMPLLSGIDMAKKIKKIDPLIKIIIISAYDDKNKLLKAIEIGVFKYLKKPIAADILIDALVECIESIKIQDEQNNFDNYIQKIFNSQTALLLFYKNGELKIANDLFLEFFKIKTVQEFNKKYLTFGKILQKKSGYLYDDENGSWFEKITSELTKFFNAVILGPDNQKHRFLISASSIPDAKDEIIVSLSNITGLFFENLDVDEEHLPNYPQNDLKSLFYTLDIIKSKQEEVNCQRRS
jgi:CheY-like chemotaxis protein